MMGFLRFVGTVNAAVWLGSVISLAIAILPAIFSHEMRTLLTPAGHADDAGFAGAVAIIVFSRFFVFQYFCAFVALLHALAGVLYLGRPFKSLTNYLLLGVVVLTLLSGMWLQPKIRDLHFQKYSPTSTTEQSKRADRSLRIHHRLSETLMLFSLAGLVVYFWRVAYPNDPTRMAGLSHKFRG